MPGQSFKNGFTLIELMVTIAILAIIATIAVPSFQSIIERNRTVTQANNFLSAVQLARSEAVKRRDTVTLTADSGNFENGWCVHTGIACNAGSQIRTFEAVNGLALAGSATSFGFSSRGERVPQTGGNITVSVQPGPCTTGDIDRRSIVTIGLSGRAEVVKGDCL